MTNKRNIMVWITIILIIYSLYTIFADPDHSSGINERSYSEFVNSVNAGDIINAVLDGEQIRYRMNDNLDYITIKPYDTRVTDLLIEHNIPMRAEKQQSSGVLTFLVRLLPAVLIIGVLFYFMHQMQGSNKGGPFGFGKSRARMLTEKQGRITFDDVAGIDEAKEELEELVEFLRNPKKFSTLGGRIPKGALLVGPPGTGKTLLSRAIAGEAGVPFFIISGSDFVEMFVGVGASRVRDMFQQAKKNAPCIVFIDEIDAVGRHRGAGYGGGNDEREQTLNQLLVEMDGFEANEGVIILAATNRKDVLDPALLRPGRFDRQISISNPDIKGRLKILDVHVRKTTPGPNVDLRIIARGTPGFSGADLANLVNEAALMASRADRRSVSMQDFEAARDKVMMGVERRSMVLTREQKEKTAYHEAGHAVVGMALPLCDPVYKATIIPRGDALGMVVALPEMDRLNHHRDECEQKLAMIMAGKAAEVIKYGEDHISNGPAGDIVQASQLARAMVMRWGMSDKIGNIDYTEAHEGYVGKTAGFSVSTRTRELIEEEVNRLIQQGYNQANEILTDQKKEWEYLAEGLLEYETLTGEEIRCVMRGDPPSDDDGSPDPKHGINGIDITAIPKTGTATKTGTGTGTKTTTGTGTGTKTTTGTRTGTRTTTGTRTGTGTGKSRPTNKKAETGKSRTANKKAETGKSRPANKTIRKNGEKP